MSPPSSRSIHFHLVSVPLPCPLVCPLGSFSPALPTSSSPSVSLLLSPCKLSPRPGLSSGPLHRPPCKPALGGREEAKMADWCPYPCQLLVLLLQLPFQLPQMFLNVAMTFLSLGAGTVSHLGDLCSFHSGPICHIPWGQGGLGDEGLRIRNPALSHHLGAELLLPCPISSLPRANLKNFCPLDPRKV